MADVRPAHEANVPGDKSISHRAILLASLADGVSTIRGGLYAADTQSTFVAMRALGVEMEPAGHGELRIHGSGLRGFRAPGAVIDCGNSGTTARLLLGILAGQDFEAVLTGDASLRARPMRRVTEPLVRMGARIDELAESDRLPLRIRGGALHALVHESPVSSAQIKSALLLAGLTGGVRVEVTEPLPSRDHTERMMAAMGVAVHREPAGRARGAPPINESGQERGAGMAGTAGPQTITLEPAHRLQAIDLTVPGDFSAAAFFIALALLHPHGRVVLQHVGINPTRTGLLSVLGRMGATVHVADESAMAGEPVATLSAQHIPLTGTDIRADEVPALIDELPALAALALRAEGETRVTGASELRVKETDRIRALVQNCRRLGGDAEELPDGFVIRGSQAPLAGRVVTGGDHRIAMAFAVLGALPGNAIQIDDRECVQVSFPGFWDELARAERAFGA